jgi:hypothetical protein
MNLKKEYVSAAEHIFVAYTMAKWAKKLSAATCFENKVS